MCYECPYCSAELIYDCSYGQGNLAAQEKYGYGWNKKGDIYRCPNAEGFDDCETAVNYYIETYDEHPSKEFEDWTGVCCETNCLPVSGSFYTDESGELWEGYPC